MSHRGRLICQMESVRLKITEHMTSVGEEILCVLDKQQLSGDVCSVQIILRVFVLERLSAAADFMFNLFQRETETLETLLERRNKLLDVVLQPHIKLHRADVLHLPVSKDKVSPEGKQRSPRLVQEQPESLHFKEELRQRPEEANGSTLTHTDENPETEPVASTSTYHLRTQADVEGCGTSRPTSDDQLLSSDGSEYAPEDSEESDGWENTSEALKEHSYSCMRNTHTALNSLKSHEKRNVEVNDNEPSKDLETSPRRSHTGRKSFSCTYCDKEFKTNNRLKRHTMIHTGEKPFTCGKGFIRMWCLKNHAMIYQMEKPLSCEMSGKASTSTEHMQTQADVEGCGTSQPTNDDQLLSSHCSESEDGDVWEETSEGRSALNTLQSHKTKTLLGQKKSLSSKLSQDVKSSKLTQTTEHGTVKRRFTCTVCGKGFGHMSHLKSHIMTHSGEKPFTCKVCGKRFGLKSSLKRHTRTHTGEKPFTCTVCGKRFKGKDGLNKHTRMHRPIEERGKPFICTVCGKGCNNIKSHMRTHTGEKPFTCTICDKGFADSGVLKVHMRTHTGERPFTCKICGKGFTHTGGLKNHTMTHTGEKPFTCTLCGKGVHHLKRHMRTHADTGEKPFTCTVCGKGITNLKRHMLTHSGDTGSPANDRPHPGVE